MYMKTVNSKIRRLKDKCSLLLVRRVRINALPHAEFCTLPQCLIIFDDKEYKNDQFKKLIGEILVKKFLLKGSVCTLFF